MRKSPTNEGVERAMKIVENARNKPKALKVGYGMFTWQLMSEVNNLIKDHGLIFTANQDDFHDDYCEFLLQEIEPNDI